MFLSLSVIVSLKRSITVVSATVRKTNSVRDPAVSFMFIVPKLLSARATTALFLKAVRVAFTPSLFCTPLLRRERRSLTSLICFAYFMFSTSTEAMQIFGLSLILFIPISCKFPLNVIVILPALSLIS